VITEFCVAKLEGNGGGFGVAKAQLGCGGFVQVETEVDCGVGKLRRYRAAIEVSTDEREVGLGR
jgi:hypothetical protein